MSDGVPPLRNLRSRGTGDCPVTAIMVTRCDGRDSTDVQYPPICSDTGPKQIKKQSAQIRTFGAHELWVGFLPAAGWSRSRALRPGRRSHADVSQDRTDLAEGALVVVHACRSSCGQA